LHSAVFVLDKKDRERPSRAALEVGYERRELPDLVERPAALHPKARERSRDEKIELELGDDPSKCLALGIIAA
jgi:hypothetical protein